MRWRRQAIGRRRVLEDAAFWALIALILFFALVLYLKVPAMLGGILDSRVDAIRKELDDARKLREEAQAVLAEYQRKAREAEGEAVEIVDQAKREAEALSIEAARRIEDYVASRTRLAEQKIAQAESQALQEVQALSADVAVAAAERILTARAKGKTVEAKLN